MRPIRLVLATALTFAVLLAGAGPAAADPAAPTDYRSEIVGIEPAVDGVTAEILGGDAFLQVTVEPGLTVVVEGYEDEPFIRFLPDGTVEHNLRSPTTYISEDRTGGVQPPPSADPDAEPEWEQVAEDGRYAWHDHRTHWMGTVPPPIDRGERVPGAFDPWRVPIVVDGAPSEILGTLTFVEAPNPLPWIAVATVAAGALALLGRAAPILAAAAALTLAAALATVLGRAEYAVSPSGAGANPLLWILPAAALAFGAVALFLSRRSTAVVLALASVASLSAWALFRLPALVRPVLPSELPDVLDRFGIAVALGVGAGAAWLAVSTGALTLPALDDDPPDPDPDRPPEARSEEDR